MTLNYGRLIKNQRFMNEKFYKRLEEKIMDWGIKSDFDEIYLSVN